MKIKVISDGTAEGTKVIDSASGEALSGVQEVRWHVRAEDHYAVATVVFVNVPVEIIYKEKLNTEITNIIGVI